MASQELQRLWKLNQVDTSLLEIRKRAAALDIGKAIQAEIERKEAEDAEVGGRARALHAEQRDIELRQKTIADKLAKIEKEMYGGTVVSNREVAALEKEIAQLKRQRDRDDERLLELFELVPSALAEAKKITDRITALKAMLVERRKKAVEEKKHLESEFARLTALRPEVAKIVAPALVARYEVIRQRTGGIGMAEVLGTVCGGCGTNQPERTLHTLREDKVATCESCHRILYYTEGLV